MSFLFYLNFNSLNLMQVLLLWLEYYYIYIYIYIYIKIYWLYIVLCSLSYSNPSNATESSLCGTGINNSTNCHLQSSSKSDFILHENFNLVLLCMSWHNVIYMCSPTCVDMLLSLLVDVLWRFTKENKSAENILGRISQILYDRN